MALVFPDSRCRICGDLIKPDVDYFATTAFLDSTNPLWPFNDAPMHWRCYLEWDRRDEFARYWAEAKDEAEKVNPFVHRVLSTPDLLVVYMEAGQVRIHLKKLAVSIDIDFGDFDTWIRDPIADRPFVQTELSSLAEQIRGLGSIDQIRSELRSQKEAILKKKEHGMKVLGLDPRFVSVKSILDEP